MRALSRKAVADRAGVEWVQGSLDDPQSLLRLVSGATAVVHCAGQVRGGSREVFDRCNVDGTERLLAAVQQSGGCERVLVMSSLAARHPQLSWYAQSKLAGERKALEAAGSMAVGIFRPTAVYGPGDQELHPLFTWMLRGWLARLGPVDAQLSFLHVLDLAAAVVQWLKAEKPGSGVYELNDGAVAGYNWSTLRDIGASVRGAPVHLLSIPTPLLRRISSLNLAWHRLVSAEPMLTPCKVNELVHNDWSSSNRAISTDIGWAPTVGLHRALQDRLF